MNISTLRSFSPLAGVVFFALVLWGIHRELQDLIYTEIVADVTAYSLPTIALAIVLTAFGYALMAGYDVLGFRYVERDEPYRRIVLPSFVGYAFSNNVKFSVLTNGSIKCQFYE
jgi:uncharacterized membrane protein YbhN (UPF0104 family)